MDLLREVREQALDPNYQARHDQDPGAISRRPIGVAAVVLLLVTGVLIGIAWRSTVARAPLDARERKNLVAHVQSAQAHESAQHAELDRLRASVNAMKGVTASPIDEEVGLDSATTAMVGPGIRIIVDDANAAPADELGDKDMRRLVNALWQAGAEAVAINGHRVGPRTAIRSAGSAITVDYVSLSRPYVVEAIGSPQKLPAELADTPGGRWMTYLRDNSSITYQVTTKDRVSVPESKASVSHASPHR
ncbi:DUF881 domain-containing protein [Cutibacterium sp. WCA-380-WT-3A]|uniref:DUF881 domain-containing protein n=1 Tax=Cutibacterium porci TaxID=2605781 RepID=A0A7K0J6H6_9ACTN|nr:DUF881 domain-containing protein [Cutibacterium porci]MSS45575.1 DUF881 domain-containing protein [Cutibacterium porci]